MEDEDTGILYTLEASVTEENTKYLNLEKYNLHLLPSSRQVATGIPVGTDKQLQHTFSIIKVMNSADKAEIIKLQVRKNDHSGKIFGVYNPTNNYPTLSLVDVSQQTIAVGDFKAYFPDVGYKNINEAART